MSEEHKLDTNSPKKNGACSQCDCTTFYEPTSKKARRKQDLKCSHCRHVQTAHSLLNTEILTISVKCGSDLLNVDSAKVKASGVVDLSDPYCVVTPFYVGDTPLTQVRTKIVDDCLGKHFFFGVFLKQAFLKFCISKECIFGGIVCVCVCVCVCVVCVGACCVWCCTSCVCCTCFVRGFCVCCVWVGGCDMCCLCRLCYVLCACGVVLCKYQTAFTLRVLFVCDVFMYDVCRVYCAYVVSCVCVCVCCVCACGVCYVYCAHVWHVCGT